MLQCSVTCGSGVQQRASWCVNSQGEMADEALCEASPRETQRACHDQHCPHWQLVDWTPVSSHCYCYCRTAAR